MSFLFSYRKAENGHENTCVFFLSMGVDPCKFAPTILWVYVPLQGHSFLNGEGTFSNETQAERSEAYHENGPSYPQRPELNAVESCLFGFRRFSRGFYLMLFQEGWKAGTRAQKSSTLRLLLQHTTSLTNCVRDEAINAAVKHYDPSLITIMMEKGANAQARHGKRSILECAAIRELLCLPTMQVLIQTRAFADITKTEPQHSLLTTLLQFHPLNAQIDHWEENNREGFFAETDTLQDLFTTAPGALVMFLLQLLPEEAVAHPGGPEFLQCAAAAGLIDLVKLTIDLKVDVNGIGSYYGTALQAAS
jgi:hypothetical protein